MTNISKLFRIGRQLLSNKLSSTGHSPTPHPDGMLSQALEHCVDQHNFANDPFGVVKTNQRLKDKILADLSDFLKQFIEQELCIQSRSCLEQDILSFYESLQENPSHDIIKGATGNGLNLWLFLLARQLQPKVIVESGVWVGRSLYTLKKAVPSAEIHAFDISFSELLFNDPSIHYHEYDWCKSNVAATDGGFCYFDDHINNGRRIREAYDKGFRHLIFDQCAPIGMCHLFRYPGLPSALMLAEDLLQEGDMLEWTWKEQKLQYCYENAHSYGAKELIEFAKPLPSLEAWTGESTGQAAYVKLKQ